MTKAKIVGVVESIAAKHNGRRTLDPLNKTIHMAIRKERARKAEEKAKRGPGPFNGIAMEALMEGRQQINAPHFCAQCQRHFTAPEGLSTHNRMKHGR